jgi:hypothetical protein
MNNSEKTPLGAYPQLLLWGHEGIAPINKRTNTTNKIVPKLIHTSRFDDLLSYYELEVISWESGEALDLP